MCPDGDKNNIDSQRRLYESLGRSDLLNIPSARKNSIGEKNLVFTEILWVFFQYVHPCTIVMS